MLQAEDSVVTAVRDALRAKLRLGDNQCDIEFDEQIPVIASDTYFAVIGLGCEMGSVNINSDGVHDCDYALQVTVFHRELVARDSRRKLLKTINYELDRVSAAISKQLDVLSLANHYLKESQATGQPFIKPLQLTGFDRKLKAVSADAYGATSAGGKGTIPFIAFSRSVYFGKMKRIEYVAQIPKGGTVV